MFAQPEMEEGLKSNEGRSLGSMTN